LGEALALSPDHLSLYQLTIEGGTRFGDMLAGGKLPGLPNDALSADLYAATQILCAEAGLPAYEVSNHCRPGQESRHNLIYWRGGDFAGIGPGAHGRLNLHGDRMATQTLRDPASWLQSVQAGQATTFRGLEASSMKRLGSKCKWRAFCTRESAWSQPKRVGWS
jgi:coproporphyrinogen III oxidase-like Fe-S oxidoreductase